MAGSALEEFTMVMAGQSPAWATSPENIQNEATHRTYTHPRLVNGKSDEERVHGGTSIKDSIFFDVKQTFHRYNPNARINYANYQHGTDWSVDWAFARAYVSWNEVELALNKESMKKKYRTQTYKRVMKRKHQNLWTDICNAIDNEYWAAPDALMETASTNADARIPYSIPAFISEKANGQATQLGTTVMGINASTQAKWANAIQTYNFQATGTVDTVSIFASMKKLKMKVKFARLPNKTEYSQKAAGPSWIACSLNGIINFEHALRVNQDQFRGMGKMSGEDPDYDGPLLGGTPLQYVEQLDTIAGVYTGSTGSESGATKTGPRYYFINGDAIVPAIHDTNYAVMGSPTEMTVVGQPDAYVQVWKMWNQVYCRSRRQQGILTPVASTINAAA
jgi:hypothetical protein